MLLNCGIGEDSWVFLDCKEIKPVNPKGNHSWIFIGRTDAEDEIPILWPPDAKNWLIWKDPDAGKDWKQEEKATTEDEMVGWHHRLSGHEFEMMKDSEAWRAAVHRVAKSWTRLSDWTELNCFETPWMQFRLSSPRQGSQWPRRRRAGWGGGERKPPHSVLYYYSSIDHLIRCIFIFANVSEAVIMQIFVIFSVLNCRCLIIM